MSAAAYQPLLTALSDPKLTFVDAAEHRFSIFG